MYIYTRMKGYIYIYIHIYIYPSHAHLKGASPPPAAHVLANEAADVAAAAGAALHDSDPGQCTQWATRRAQAAAVLARAAAVILHRTALDPVEVRPPPRPTRSAAPLVSLLTQSPHDLRMIGERYRCRRCLAMSSAIQDSPNQLGREWCRINDSSKK